MSKKLLLADDSITIQKVIQITFAHEDYQLTITDNGDTALARAQELVPDLVLADVTMPGKNGYELCAAIKESPALQHIPVLLLAGSFEPFDEGRARAAGANAWIEKPFESQALIDKVAELLSTAPERADGAVTPAPVAEPEAAPELVDPFADFAFEDSAAVPVEPEDFVFEEISSSEPNFEFIDEPFLVEAERPEAFVDPPASAPAFATFGPGEEMLPLDDDDILGAEDLEPIAEISTLTPWSRDEVQAEEPFPAFAELELPPFVPASQPETAQEPEAEAAAELAAASVPVGAEPGATMLSAEQLELIVERAVARALEKLAGTVLERVAWEVVPDMAEALIKEEIRQIKETSA